MKTLTTILTLLIGIISYSQGKVGIGTTNPLETLDVNGTARVESLGAFNPLNNGVKTKVYADGNGKLILSNDLGRVVYSNENFILIPIGLDQSSTDTVIFTYTFTVDYDRLVRFTSELSVNYFRDSAYRPIDDGIMRLTGSSLLLNGNPISVDRNTYTNNRSTWGETVTGYKYLKHYREMFLTAGTYTVELEVFVNNSYARTYVEFGGNTFDLINIIQD